jgi:hypothetical protein
MIPLRFLETTVFTTDARGKGKSHAKPPSL